VAIAFVVLSVLAVLITPDRLSTGYAAAGRTPALLGSFRLPRPTGARMISGRER
jgi:hypothetical protein